MGYENAGLLMLFVPEIAGAENHRCCVIMLCYLRDYEPAIYDAAQCKGLRAHSWKGKRNDLCYYHNEYAAEGEPYFLVRGSNEDEE